MRNLGTIVVLSVLLVGCGSTLHYTPNGSVLMKSESGTLTKVLGGLPMTEVEVLTPEWGYCEIFHGEVLRAKTSPEKPRATIHVVRFYGVDAPDRFTLKAVCEIPGGFRGTDWQEFRLLNRDRYRHRRYRDRNDVLMERWDLRAWSMRGQGGTLVLTLVLDEGYDECVVAQVGEQVVRLVGFADSEKIKLVRDPMGDYAQEAVLTYGCRTADGELHSGIEKFRLPDSEVRKEGWKVP